MFLQEGLDESPVRYAVYISSAYIPTILIAGLPTIVRKARVYMPLFSLLREFCILPFGIVLLPEWSFRWCVMDRAAYHGLLIYVMATYAFYRITVSIVNAVKYHKLYNPVLSASKVLDFATALMAIFWLETAMLVQQIMTSATGSAVYLIIFGIAIFMIVRVNKELKKPQINIIQT